MKSINPKFLLIFAIVVLYPFFASAQITERDINESALLNAQFTREMVWDAQRFPTFPSAGREWELSELKPAYDFGTRSYIDWGRNSDRYLMFELERYNSNLGISLIDDIDKSARARYNVTLNLYERDWRFVKRISRWGKLMGFGSGGFMYEQEGMIGTFFAVGRLREGSSVKYRPEIAQLEYLSEIVRDRGYEDDNSDEISFLTATYSRGQVWDVQRWPVYPALERDWTLSRLKAPYDRSINSLINWGRYNDRYLMFELEYDNSGRGVSLIDDIENSGRRYFVALKLFESDGRYVKTVSRWGRLMGFGSGGFLYEQEGTYGTFFTGERTREGGTIAYRPEVIQIKYVSEIVNDVAFLRYAPNADYRPNIGFHINAGYHPRGVNRPREGYHQREGYNQREGYRQRDEYRPNDRQKDNVRPNSNDRWNNNDSQNNKNRQNDVEHQKENVRDSKDGYVRRTDNDRKTDVRKPDVTTKPKEGQKPVIEQRSKNAPNTRSETEIKTDPKPKGETKPRTEQKSKTDTGSIYRRQTR